MEQIKTLAYCPLLYGKDYLKQALLSVYEVVDEIVILYTPKPSHGSGTNLICPDTEQELIDIVADIDSEDKIKWIKGNWNAENEQRNYAHTYAKGKGFDILVAVDFDEVWKTEILKELIQLTYDRKASKCLIWMRHLWRSFNYICDDPMRQERLYYLGADKQDLIYAPQPTNQVWHFGYARKLLDIEYKISIHGHSAEWLRPKAAWLIDKYKPFPPTQNVHPVCENTWHPKPFDKSELPDIMKDHEWYNSEVIQ